MSPQDNSYIYRSNQLCDNTNRERDRESNSDTRAFKCLSLTVFIDKKYFAKSIVAIEFFVDICIIENQNVQNWIFLSILYVGPTYT